MILPGYKPNLKREKSVLKTPLSKGFISLWVCILLVCLIVGIFYLQSKFSSAVEIPQTSISIESSGFQPPTVNIKAGSQVTWINSDIEKHQIRSSQLLGLSAPEPLLTGESYSYIFETKGTYSYYDVSSDVLQGTIIVE